MVELRTDAASVIKALKNGIGLILTYRGKRIAKIEPIKNYQQEAESDPVFAIAESAVPAPGEPLDHASIDKILYR